LFDEAEVGFSVDANGVVVRGFDVNVEAVFEEAELFEAFGAFELAGGQGGEAIERGFAIGVQADVLPVSGGCTVAVERDCGAGEVKGAAVGGGNDFYCVRIRDVFRGAADLQCGHIDLRMREGAKQCSDVVGPEERLVALDVDVDVGVVQLCDGMEAIGSAGEIGRREFHGDVELAAKIGDLFGVGCDKNLIKLRTCAGGVDDPGQQRAPGNLAK